MGATEFENVIFSLNSIEAFSELKKECGDTDGYSGTIAEKESYIMVEMPSRVSVEQAVNWIYNASYVIDCCEEERPAAIRMFESKCPDQHRGWVKRYARKYSDKFGPALCIRWNEGQSREWKKGSRFQGKRGNVYTFIGIASC